MGEASHLEVVRLEPVGSACPKICHEEILDSIVARGRHLCHEAVLRGHRPSTSRRMTTVDVDPSVSPRAKRAPCNLHVNVSKRERMSRVGHRM